MCTYDVVWKCSALKARGYGRFVGFEPHPCEGTSRFGFGWWCVWYGERFYDRKVFLVIIPDERVSKDVGGGSDSNVHCESTGDMVEKWILGIYIRGHVRDCHVIDAEKRMGQGWRIGNGEENIRIGVYPNVGKQLETLKEHPI